jgi:guanylate kinase
MRFISDYDYLIINKDFDKSLKRVKAIAMSSRYIQTRFDLDDFVIEWRGDF